MSISKFITRRNPSEIRDLGINLNDFAPAREPRDSLFSGIAKAVRRNIPVQQTPFIGRDFSQFDLAKMGQLPIIPGYNEEMDIDDTGRITLGDRFRDLADRAQEGILNTLTGQDRRSSLTRAGLGSILFGFNPLTAILGAFAGSKLPGITSALQQGKFNPLEFVREKRAEREAARAREQAAAAAQIQQQNRMDETGGYQSSFADDTSFMEGSGTAADMGSF
jgi:hypothetical protein